MTAVIKEGDVDHLHSRIDQLEALAMTQGKALLAQSEAMEKIAGTVVSLSGLTGQTSHNVEALAEGVDNINRALKAIEEVIKQPIL